MTRRPVSDGALPLYPSEAAIAARVLGDNAKQWDGLAAVWERQGLPPIDPITGRRFGPAVEAFFMKRHGLLNRSVPAHVDGFETFPVTS